MSEISRENLVFSIPDVDYKRYLKRLSLELEVFARPEKSGQIFFGPQYLGQNSHGQSVRIFSFGENNRDKHKLGYYWLICQDLSGQTLGNRRMLIEHGENLLIAEGTIRIGAKGFGLSKAVELANVDMLQRISNSSNKNLKWEIKNENLERLEQARSREDFWCNKQQNNQLEAEQRRWLATYGEDGFLNTRKISDKYYFKFFTAKHNADKNDHLKNIEKINFKLGRTAEESALEPKIYASAEEQEKERKKRFAYLRDLISNDCVKGKYED